MLGGSMRFISTSKVEAGGCIELLIKRVTRWTFSSQLNQMQPHQAILPQNPQCSQQLTQHLESSMPISIKSIPRHFHRSQTIEEIVAAAGCQLWYLPPYSPDLNQIEQWWFVLKNWMRQRWDEFDSFRDCKDNSAAEFSARQTVRFDAAFNNNPYIHA